MYVLKCYWVEFIASSTIGSIVAIVSVAGTIPSIFMPLNMEISFNKCIFLGNWGYDKLKEYLCLKNLSIYSIVCCKKKDKVKPKKDFLE